MQKARCGRIWLPSGVEYDDPVWASIPGDRPPLSASAYDDEFNDASIDTKWAWRNQGTSTIVEADGIETLTIPTSGAGDNLRIREQTCPTANFTLSAKLSASIVRVATNGTLFGLVLVNNSTGKCITLNVLFSASVAQFEFNRWTSVTAFSASIYTTSALWVPMHAEIGLRIVKSGSTLATNGNLNAYWSGDGYSWRQIQNTTETVAGFIASVDRIGFVASNNAGNALPADIDIHWFRVS